MIKKLRGRPKGSKSHYVKVSRRVSSLSKDVIDKKLDADSKMLRHRLKWVGTEALYQVIVNHRPLVPVHKALIKLRDGWIAGTFTNETKPRGKGTEKKYRV